MVSSLARRLHLRLGLPWGSGVPVGLIGLSTRLILLSAAEARRANQLDAGPPLQSGDVGDLFLTSDDRLGCALGASSEGLHGAVVAKEPSRALAGAGGGPVGRW